MVLLKEGENQEHDEMVGKNLSDQKQGM